MFFSISDSIIDHKEHDTEICRANKRWSLYLFLCLASLMFIASYLKILYHCLTIFYSSLSINSFVHSSFLSFFLSLSYCNERFAVINNQLHNSISCFVHVDEYHHNEEYTDCSFHFFDSVKAAFTTNTWKERRKSERIET
jgi:hypothetical protein